MTHITIDQIDPTDCPDLLDDLTQILKACVETNASIGFILPLETSDARAFWQNKVFPHVQTGGRVLFVARAGAQTIGTVQLVTEMLPSQVHRCEVSKLLVHPNHRKQGIGKQLMTTLESQAVTLGKSLITLDTKTGDTAEPLYTALGYQTAGSIPDYCRNASANVYDATTYMYKRI